MPELPEVENVKNSLNRQVQNKKIIAVVINYPNIIEYPSKELFEKEIINETIINIKRRGKWLLFELNHYYLLSHLRMEGKYHIRNVDDQYSKHEHISFTFENNEQLRYQDTRKFGRMHLIEKDDLYKRKPLSELGLEPWDELLTVSYLKEKLKNKKLPIKTTILDQSIITGIGNIYANEILFLSNIYPLKPSNKVNDNELQIIIDNTKEVLEKAIKLGGTTIRSYESSEGVHGNFQDSLYVHGKQNELCSKCSDKIVKIQVNGRGTYYCPSCQEDI